MRGFSGRCDDDLYYIQIHHSTSGGGGGAKATNPLSSTHTARPRPLVPSSFTLTGIVCGRAPFSSLPCIRALFVLQEGCGRPVVSSYASTRRRRTRTVARQRIIRTNIFFILCVFLFLFNGKGEVFIYFGSLSNTF